MTETERYDWDLNGIWDYEDDDEDYISEYEDLSDLLNEQDERIKDLETRNNRQYERLKNIGDLMFKRDWKTLETMVDEWEREDEYLRKYGG